MLLILFYIANIGKTSEKYEVYFNIFSQRVHIYLSSDKYRQRLPRKMLYKHLYSDDNKDNSTPQLSTDALRITFTEFYP